MVTSHSSQCDRLASLLASDRYGLPGVRCDTADHLQGGQWPVVIAVDPLVGHHRASTHQLAPGRLCVMLSRHTSTLIWLHDGKPGRLEELAESSADAQLGIEVRDQLAAARQWDRASE